MKSSVDRRGDRPRGASACATSTAPALRALRRGLPRRLPARRSSCPATCCRPTPSWCGSTPGRGWRARSCAPRRARCCAPRSRGAPPTTPSCASATSSPPSCRNLLAGDAQRYHDYAFATVRMVGSAFEVGADHVEWVLGEAAAAAAADDARRSSTAARRSPSSWRAGGSSIRRPRWRRSAAAWDGVLRGARRCAPMTRRPYPGAAGPGAIRGRRARAAEPDDGLGGGGLRAGRLRDRRPRRRGSSGSRRAVPGTAAGALRAAGPLGSRRPHATSTPRTGGSASCSTRHRLPADERVFLRLDGVATVKRSVS